jgi:hypothetical protein
MGAQWINDLPQEVAGLGQVRLESVVAPMRRAGDHGRAGSFIGTCTP